MWRGLMLTGIGIATFGGMVILVVLAIGAACSGSTYCGPASDGGNTIATSIGTLIAGSGFLIVIVALGIRPRGLPEGLARATNLPALYPPWAGAGAYPTPAAPVGATPPYAVSAAPLLAPPPPSPSAGHIPECATCGRPAAFVADQGRAFCPNCGRWL